MPENIRFDRGWWWPPNSKKAHYFVDGRSLCGRWASLRSKREYDDSDDEHPDNCAECMQRVKGYRKRLEETKP